jgi:hypothetical protein
MAHVKTQSLLAWSPIRTVAIIVLLLLYAQCLFPDVVAAASGGVDLGPITIAPAVLSPGQYPNIEARVSRAPKVAGKYIVVNIIAVVTQPDHRVRSWHWGKVKITRGAARTVTVPKKYDTSFAGTYRVEVMVYSGDMKRMLATRTVTFEVADRSKALKQTGKQPSAMKESAPRETAGDKREHPQVSIGIYGNALNPAGGGTIFLWPSKHVGVQGSATTGEFTSYEGRLLARIEGSGGQGIYGGIGFIHVTKNEDIIGVGTKFEDRGVSGVVGLELPLGKKMLLCLEVSAARIELKQTVTNGARTVQASVKYAPVTIGAALILPLF